MRSKEQMIRDIDNAILYLDKHIKDERDIRHWTLVRSAALVFLEAMENAKDSEDDEREMTNGSL